MRSADVRKTFLDYFAGKGHPILPSSSVIPHGDKTLLFTNAGMVQFKDIFTGRQPAPEAPRATTVQKCVRAGGKHNDLDNVGYTTRHLTFFEMLGNFSFGDYFKEDAIAYAWELITKGFGLGKDRLWVTVFHEDDEARQIWKKVSGLSSDRIVGLGEKDNYWSMGDVGPCGPCSEILLDRGDAFGEADVENGERFFEIWNLVFMQFDQSADGTKKPLPRPSIDTGMGLERMAMVLQGVDTVFETDVLRRIIGRVEELSGASYDPGPAGVAHRVLADHVRSLVFCLADGAELSNEGRGYVLRRILRRASRYGRKISSEGTIIHRLVDTLIDEMGDAYPEIVEEREYITRQIRREEERFGETLDRGIEIFEEISADLAKAGKKVVPGEEIFKLYDTFGFPDDLVQVMASEAGLGVDLAGFQKCMEAQKERSRGASSFAVDEGEAAELQLASVPQTRFVGYDELEAEGEVLAVARAGDLVQVVLSETPFYGEGGGQVGDVGVIVGEGFRLRVEDTQKRDGRHVHVARLEEGELRAVRPGAIARAAVDAERRISVQRNHSATHLLHAALREVLGKHVRQKGSLVEGARLRFDVTHDQGISREELLRAEDLVIENVLANHPVETLEMDREQAIAEGAMAFFGEKYGDLVRVVRMGDFSMELCGGCHVGRTGDIGSFALVREGSVSAGVRRVEAVSGLGAEALHREQSQCLEQLAQALKVTPDRLQERVERLLEENRELRKAREKAAASGDSGQVSSQSFGDVVFFRGLFEGLDGKALRGAYDELKQKGEHVVVALISRAGDKAQALVGVSHELTKRGWKAADVFGAGASAIQARGGGRPELVQAGGTAPAGAEEALKAIEQKVAELASR